MHVPPGIALRSGSGATAPGPHDGTITLALWPKEWSPAILVATAQTGNRITVSPSKARDELTGLKKSLQKVRQEIGAMKIEPVGVLQNHTHGHVIYLARQVRLNHFSFARAARRSEELAAKSLGRVRAPLSAFGYAVAAQPVSALVRPP